MIRAHDSRGLVRLSAIYRVAQQIAKRFEPDKVILYGSYAYGWPRPESDVDLLVVTLARDENEEAHRIRKALDAPFRVQILVRTPKNIHWRLAEGDGLLQDAFGKGRVLYDRQRENRDGNPLASVGGPKERRDGIRVRQSLEAPMKKLTAEWVRKAEADFDGAKDLYTRSPPLFDLVCFHSQQTVEKYFKALLEERVMSPPRTHDLSDLLALLLPRYRTLRSFAPSLDEMTEHAVTYRYPGIDATPGQARSAIRKAEKVRKEIRKRLGIPAGKGQRKRYP